jgi:small subunit ribosomal protein S6
VRRARPSAGAAFGPSAGSAGARVTETDHRMGCMRTYELMIITHGGLDEATVQGVIERFTKLVADQGGSVEKTDHWGKRQFAYEIGHMREGYYTVIDFEIGTEGLNEVDRQLRLADEVVRHKIVRPAVRSRAS